MDDKNDPYNKLYPPKPPLPPFSSLRPRTSSLEARYGASESNGGYGTSLSSYHHHHQQQHSFPLNSYLQGSSSHFHQQPPVEDFPFQNLAGVKCPQRGSQYSQHNICPSSSFLRSSAQGSHCSIGDQSQYLDNLQQPPIPDMSLSLPFSSGQPGLIGNSNLPVGSQKFSSAGCFPSNVEHPEMAISQVGSFVTEAEQKSFSDFNVAAQTLNNHERSSAWHPSFNSVPGQQPEHLPSFSSFSSFCTKTSSTKEMCLNSGLVKSAGGIKSHDSRFCVQEKSSRLPPSVPSLPGLANYESNTAGFNSQYQSSRDIYSENCFLSKRESAHSLDIPCADFSEFESLNYEPKQMFEVPLQGNQTSTSGSNFMMNSGMAFGAVHTPLVTKQGQKSKKVKKLTEESPDTGIRTAIKRTKAKTQRLKRQPKRGLSLEMPDVNNDSDSISPASCLSPTFIASLSSKRAAGGSHHPPPSSDTSPCVIQQHDIPQKAHSIQNKIHQNHEVPVSQGNHLSASEVFQNTGAVPRNTGAVPIDGMFVQPETSEISSSGNAAHFTYAHSESQRGGSQHGSQVFKQPVGHNYTQSSQSDFAYYTSKPSETFHVKADHEENSHSPFQLSPVTLASLSSKKAEGPSQILLNEMASVTANSLKSHHHDYQASLQSVQTSFSLSANQSEFLPPVPSSFSNSRAAATSKPQIFDDLDPSQSQSIYTKSFSVNQEHGLINVPRQACSPTSYASLPPYPEGSEFQYPTPPMEDDESKLHSPGPHLSPAFLDSLSNKVISDELAHRLSPVHDDSVYALPTPPNSAGPKLPSAPEITLSKEEQTSRILEIIAREREKSASTSQAPVSEPKKKKKRKKLKATGNSGDDFETTNMSMAVHVGQNPPFVSDLSVTNSVPVGQPFHSYQKYPGMSVTEVVPNAVPAHTNSSVSFNSNTVIPINKPVNHLFHKHLQQFDPKQDNNFLRWSSSDCVENVDMYNQNQNLERTHHNIHSLVNEWQKGSSPKFNMKSFKINCAGTQEDPSTEGHHSPQKAHLTRTSQLCDTKATSSDPYAFDDSEQRDLNICLTRNLKPVHKLPCTAGTDPTSIIPVQTQCPEKLPPDGKKTFSKQTPGQKIQHPATFSCSENKILPDNLSHSEGKHQIQLSKMFVKNEHGTDESQSQHNQFDPDFMEQMGSQQKPDIVKSTSALLTDQCYQQKLEDGSFQDASDSSFNPASTIIKQEFQNQPQSMHHVEDYHISFHNSFSAVNGHGTDILKSETKGPAVFGIAKKRRGRPPKSVNSTTTPVNPKAPKLKMHESKAKIQTPRKFFCKLNGTEIKCDGFNLNPDLVDRLANNLMEVADCSCLGPDHIPSETTEGPYYTQLGAAKDIPGVRKVMEERTGLSGSAIRIEKVIFTGKEGKSKEGCPVAKWIIRRSAPEEKYLCIVRKRPGHFCDTAVIIISVVAWEGVDRQQADTLYDFLISTLPQNGIETDRRCGLNEKKTCACQGVDLLRRGASFSFGCSWSMYYNGCKFARSQVARKFKLKDPDHEEELEDRLQKLATDVAPLYSRIAPDAFRNQIQFESQAEDCRLGRRPGRPFSGVTAVVDFCCHSHRDCHNMNNGCTVVVNLTKHRGYEKPDDEQFHVLPLYILDQTDEFGSMEGQMAKMRSGALEVLSRYMSQVRLRSTPYRPCKRNRTATKMKGSKRGPKKMKLMKSKSFSPGKYPDDISPKSESSFSEDGFLLPQSPSVDKKNNINEIKHSVMVPDLCPEDRNKESMSYTDLMSQQGTPGFGELYTKFWDYFYTHGEFPPQEWTSTKRVLVTSNAVGCPLASHASGQQPAIGPTVLQQQQQWQHQEQRRQQLNTQGQTGQQQQQGKQRQQIFPAYISSKQEVETSSPQSQHSSLRQQHHSHGHHFHTSITKTSQPPPLHAHSSASSHGSASTKRPHCIPTPQPYSIPLPCSAIQQTNSLKHKPFSSQSHFINNESNNDSSEADTRNMHIISGHGESTVMVLQSNSQNYPNHNQSAALAACKVQTGNCDDTYVKPPPSYRQSIYNQHNIQCSPQEALCSLQAQGSPPSYSESLAQSAHNNCISFSDAQTGICAPKFPSSHSLCRSQVNHFSQSAQFAADSNFNQAYPVQGSLFSPGLQRSSSSPSLEKQPPSQLESGSLLSQSVPKPCPAQLSRQPSTSHLTPRPSSAHSVERPPSAHSTSRNSYVESLSCPASVQSISGAESVNSQQRSHFVHLTNEPSASTLVEMSSSTSSVSRLSNEKSAPEFPSQTMKREHSSLSLVGIHHIPQPQKPPTEKSFPYLDTTSSPWCVNKPQYFQTEALRIDSVTEEININSVDSDLQKCYMGKPESDIPSSLNVSLVDKQAKVVRDRCWSRMSEPATGSETVRPSSSFSEPGILSGCGRDPSLNQIAPDILASKHNFEIHQRPEKIEFNDRENVMQRVSHMPHLQEKDCRASVMVPNSFSSSYVGNRHSEISSNGGSSLSVQAGNIKSFQSDSSGQSPAHGSKIKSQFASSSIPNEVFCNGLFINESMGSVCPNGPVIGEKLKVHKTEGFVVPKLGQGPREPPYEVIDSTVVSVETDDNREVFEDPAMGGVAIALCHGAVLFEVAKRELHATTALKEPNRYQPKRISLVFYQHKNLNLTGHGFDEYERKTEERRNQAEQARLIEEMESKGFLKGELRELATFPNLTKGTFGKVFNFPESRKALFPLHFPRYLDSSQLEHITPVMFACMSIAFPNYMKEAFPDPSKLPRLMSGHMPVRMHSSLSDGSDRKLLDSEAKEIGLTDLFNEEYAGKFQRVLGTWNPNIPQGFSVTTNSVITRWMNDDVIVTGPYNRWVDLAQKDAVSKDAKNVSEARYEDVPKEKMLQAPPEHDHQDFSIENHMCLNSFKSAEPNMKASEDQKSFSSAASVVVNLEPAHFRSKPENSNNGPTVDNLLERESSAKDHMMQDMNESSTTVQSSELVNKDFKSTNIADHSLSRNREVSCERVDPASCLDELTADSVMYVKNEVSKTVQENGVRGSNMSVGDSGTEQFENQQELMCGPSRLLHQDLNQVAGSCLSDDPIRALAMKDENLNLTRKHHI